MFFGREAETERLLEVVQPSVQGRGRFVAVVGPSGSGKSSLVRAGLLPRLARLPHRWLVVPRLVPGDQPRRQLARSLAQAFRAQGEERSPLELQARLEGGASALAGLVEDLRDQSTGAPPSVLLVVDQAEELVTLTGEPERSAFLALLHRAVHGTRGLSVLTTLRAEFLGLLLRQPGAGQLVDETLLVSPLDRSLLPAAVEGPANRAGLQFAPGLVGRLVEDTHGGDALPLLAFTLRQLTERAGPDGQITSEAYEASGGVVGALRAQADRTAAELATRGYGELVVATLTRLATVAADGAPTRRGVSRTTLSAAEEQVVQAFVDARLLISKDDQGEAVVEVAHEALLRQWPPLRQRIEARREDLRLRADLERWVQDWEGAARQGSYLIGGERLSTAQRWAAAHPQELSRAPGAREFLARSAGQHHQAMRLRSEAVAAYALAELDWNPELATLLAIAAVEEYGPSPRSTLALSAALATSYLSFAFGSHEGAVLSVAFSPDGTRLATASNDHTAQVWNLTSHVLLHTLGGHTDEVVGVAFSPDGARLATASRDRTARIWDVATGNQLHTLRHPAAVLSVAFGPEGTHLATASGDYTARIWDVGTGRQHHALHHPSAVQGVAFSPDGTQLATASGDHTARIWEVTTGAE